MLLYLDLETYSRVNLPKTGVHVYAEHASTGIDLFGYAIDNAPAKVVRVAMGEPLPDELVSALSDPKCMIAAHNTAFDRNILKEKLSYRFPTVGDTERWLDTMIIAYSLSLPGGLGDLCTVLGVPQDVAKDKDGRRLVKKFCTVTPDLSVKALRVKESEDYDRYVNYCRLDVEALRYLYKRLPKFNYSKDVHDAFVMDQTINDRGAPVDMELVDASITLALDTKEDKRKEMQSMTGGAVESATKRMAFVKFLEDNYGLKMNSVGKASLEAKLNDPDTPEDLKELLRLKLDASKTSVAKYETLKQSTCWDWRNKGLFQFYGASRTGRWAGRRFQPQNLPRIGVEADELDDMVESVKSGMTSVLYDDLSVVLGACLRGSICAPEGKKLVIADLSNIEGRVLAWLAGEEYKLEAFRKCDAGEGPDLYKVTYGRTFGIDPKDVDKSMRQIGKVLELGLGYEGGVGAFLTFAKVYGVNLDDLADRTYKSLDNTFIESARSSYDFFVENKLTHGLSGHTFIALDAIKRAWRERHPMISKFWKEVEEACVTVLSGFADEVKVGKHISVLMPRLGWLAVRLPSGRMVTYPGARLPKDGERAGFVFRGMHQLSKKWGDVFTYSGKITENITQAVARDILLEGMRNAEMDGYEVVMHVHDEIIAETVDDEAFSVAGLSDCMTDAPAWAEGLPLSAAGFEGKRYRKEA